MGEPGGLADNGKPLPHELLLILPPHILCADRFWFLLLSIEHCILLPRDHVSHPNPFSAKICYDDRLGRASCSRSSALVDISCWAELLIGPIVTMQVPLN
jgi:hypothetical protein